MMTHIQKKRGKLFMANNHYVYILQCGDGTLYTGYTNDLQKRIEKHENGEGAKYTRGRGPFQLVYTENFSTKSLAMKREYEIKKLTRSEKLALIATKIKEDVHECTYTE